MKTSRSKLLLTILIIFLSFSTFNYVFAWDFSYTNITPESKSQIITKTQKVFLDLWLYNWEINWDYEELKTSIINFQLENWIIKSKDEEVAGYIWPKTYKKLNELFWNKFDEVYKKYFEIKEVIVWTKTKFVVTAYYSPLPFQEKYFKWNYEDEIKLNGHWIRWASWKPVSPWFIAAPKNYKFGTKIKLEGLWVWVVEDRWWAIVNSWERWYEYDRLDIWMWYWDIWLQRALKWWKKTVDWEIMSEDTEVSIKLEPLWNEEIEESEIQFSDNKEEKTTKKSSLLTEEQILEKYNFSKEDKAYIDILAFDLKKTVYKKLNWDKNKVTSAYKKIEKNIDKIIQKSKSDSLKNKLNYLKSLI